MVHAETDSNEKVAGCDPILGVGRKLIDTSCGTEEELAAAARQVVG
jgi:hypothetical protein